MVPNGSAYANYPSFANNGTKTPPGGSTESAKYALGMVPADTFPAEWANYLFHGATAGITRLNADTGSIKKEINSVLEAYGITPDAAVYNQLLSALSKIYPQICECTTPAATAAKSVALQGNVLKAGNVYVITMTYGNTAANPTLSINSGTAYPMCDCDGVQLGSGDWKAGDILNVIFTGTKYLLNRKSEKKVFDTLHPIGETYTQYPGQKSPNQLWGDFSTWEVLNYGSAFFRTEGGNADPFEKSLAISTINGTSITFTTAHNLQVGTILYDSVNNESRKVASVTNTTTVVLNSAFTSTEITSVLIAQIDCLQKFGIARGCDAAGAPNLYGYPSSGTQTGDMGYRNFVTEPVPATLNGEPIRTGTETRPLNFTVRIWKRIA